MTISDNIIIGEKHRLAGGRAFCKSIREQEALRISGVVRRHHGGGK